MKREKFIKIVSFAIALFAGTALYAQGVKDLRFNEVLVRNTNGLQNEMGHTCGWIEFRNSGYATAELGGCQIVAVYNSGERIVCAVPRGVAGTTIPPQGYLVMFLDPSSDAPLTTNFTLDGAKYMLLYDASGKGQPLDSVVINQSISENVALSREPIDMRYKSTRDIDNNTKTRNSELEIVPTPTPGYANYPAPKESRAELFRRLDSTGIAMTVIAMSVVFLALLLLFLIFREVGRLLQNMAKKKEAKKNPIPAPVVGSTAVSVGPKDLNAEQLAAIALAINMYDDEMNQSESKVLTINRTAKFYSPWSSKIHGLTRIPDIKRNR